MKYFIPTTIVLVMFQMYSFGQNEYDSLRYWSKSDLYKEFDTIGRSIQMHLFLGETEFVFENFDHAKDRIVFGQYEIDSIGNMTMKYDLEKAHAFRLKNDDPDRMLQFYANIHCNRFINWKMKGDCIIVEYILRDGRPETKTYTLKRRKG